MSRLTGHSLEEAPSSEMTLQEVSAHALAIAAATSKEDFVATFAAYVADVVSRESEPYVKVALFVHGMVEGLRETVAELITYRGGGAA